MSGNTATGGTLRSRGYKLPACPDICKNIRVKLLVRNDGEILESADAY